MTAFESAVHDHCKELDAISSGINPECPQCQSDYAMDRDELAQAVETGRLASEPFCSSSDCDSCGASLQGDRYDGHALLNGELVHLTLCEDCVCYHANGDIPQNWEA